MDRRLDSFGPNWPKMHNCAEWEALGKTDQGYFYQSIMLRHAKMFQKKTPTLTDHEI